MEPSLAKDRHVGPTADRRSQLASDPVFAFAQVTVLVKIIVTVFALDPQSIDAFTLPKSVAAHATSLLVAALLVWLLLRHGPAMVLFWSPVHAGVGAVLFTFALATPFAIDPVIALFGAFRRYLGLTQMLDDALLYLAVALLFRDPRSLRLLVTVCIGAAVPALGYALVQRLGLDPLTFRQTTTQIPISFMGNPDIAGAFFSVIGVTALGLALLLPGRLAAWYRPVLAATGAACVAILFATGARSGVLAIAAGWVATFLIALAMPNVARRRAMAAAAVAILLASGALISPLGARLSPANLGLDPALTSRLDIWRAAAVVVVDHPVLGIGPDNFVAAYPSRRTQASISTGELQNSTHDVWLYVATSAGVVGLGAFVLLVVLAIEGGIRLVRRGHPGAIALVPLAAYLGQALVNVNEIVVDWIFWTSLGAIVAASAPIAAPRRAQAPPRAARPVGVALVFASIAAIMFLAPRIAAGEAMLAADAYAIAQRAAEATSYGEAAVSADARRSETWSSYGSALFGAHDTTAALQAFSRAAATAPWHPQSWMNLAVTWDALGNVNAAYAAAVRAPQVDPYDPNARELLADLAFRRGDYRRAADEGERAIAYGGPTAHDPVYFTTISAYVRLKQLDRAEALGREAVSKFPTSRFRVLLAAILADQGKSDEALGILDAILRDEPNNTDARSLRNAIQRR